ncbi:MAG: ribosome hibernation-promoting factor, HPF/YfiA family [Polyangiales bacterium]
MNIAITFRHVDPSEAVKDYARDKVGKLQKFLRSPLKASVILAVEKGEQVAEVQLNAGSEHYTAKEVSDNMYASLDKVCDKLEHQIHHAKGVKESAKRGGMSAGQFATVQSAEEE